MRVDEEKRMLQTVSKTVSERNYIKYWLV